MPLPLSVICNLPLLHAALLLSTTRRPSLYRLTFLPTLATAIYWRLFILPDTPSHPVSKCAAGMFIAIFGIHAFNLLYIHPNPTTTSTSPTFLAAVLLVFNLRGINTPWQARNLPPWPSYYHPHHPPSRALFLVRQTAIFLWQYLVLDFMLAQSGQGVTSTSLLDLKWLVLDPASSHWWLRAASAIWVGNIFLRIVIDGIYRSFSIICVLGGIAAPADFPPLYGSMWEMYSLRGVWGKYWHQFFQVPLRTLIAYLFQIVTVLSTRRAHKRSRLSYSFSSAQAKIRLLRRYTTVLLVFLFSGLIHHFASPAIDDPMESSRAVPYFVLFAVGLLVEDVVRSGYKRVEAFFTRRGQGQQGRYRSGSRSASGYKYRNRDRDRNGYKEWKRRVTAVLRWLPWQRGVGFLWVMAWMALVAGLYTADLVTVFAQTKMGVPVSLMERVGVEWGWVLLLGYGGVVWWLFEAEI